jgi:hypothetical protein
LKGFAMSHPHSSADELAGLAAQINAQFTQKAFGGIWFWQFAVVRPHDEGQILLSCQALGSGEQARLELQLQHASGQGHSAVLSVWQPQGLSIDAQGLRLQNASRLHFGKAQAWADDSGYRLQSPAGEGSFATQGLPALNLQV